MISFEKVLLKFSILLEDISSMIRENIKKRKINKFLKKYNIEDEYREEIIDGKYNSYDATNLVIIDKIIERRIVSVDEVIYDIGCGTGIFLLYLASKGFRNLNGIEIDNKLYGKLEKNIHNFEETSNIKININIKNSDAIETYIEKNINCIFLANPMIGKEEYYKLFNNIKKSLEEKDRDMKIIIFRMTNELKKVLMDCNWLEFDNLYLFKEQICYHCFNIVVVKHKVS